MPRFRFSAIQVGLTYSQCPSTPEELLQHFQSTFEVTEWCISQESHEDGGKHLHAYFKFPRKVDSQDPRVFDYLTFHPSIERLRSRKAWLVYIRKDGAYIESEGLPHERRSWGEILEASTTREAFLAAVAAEYPRDYVLQLERLQYFANFHYQVVMPPYVSRWAPDDFHVLDEITQWLDQRNNPGM